MTKRFFVIAAASLMAISMLSACSGSSASKTEQPDNNAGSAATSSSQQDASETVSKRDLPEGDYADTGAGTMYISTASGTSEDDVVPVLFVSDEDILIQIGLDTIDFDGAHLSYIYVDGMLNTREQLSESQISLDLSGNALSVGQHDVEVVQYDSDEPDGQIVTYKAATYEVKEN
ncbi:MAG: hypothetical protein ACI3X2_00200 [Butyricicoccus porcorum]